MDAAQLNNRSLYLEKMLEIMGTSDEEKAQTLKTLTQTIQARVLCDLLKILPEDQKNEFIGKIKNIQAAPEEYLTALFNLTKNPEVQSAIGKSIDEELTIFEDNFMKTSSDEQKQQMLSWLQQTK